MADPETIVSIIRKRGVTGRPPRMRARIGEALSPSELVWELIEHHNYLNTKGPTDQLSELRKWLFSYVDMYVSYLKAEDAAPEYALAMPFIKAKRPITQRNRKSIAEALALKKQINMQVRALRARNIWH